MSCCFFSNLFEKNSYQQLTVSHNMAILPGPNLNKKISTCLLQLRFDKKLICFDLEKAFLQIALNSVDQNRLLFLWFQNVEKNYFTIIAYRHVRLAFGLRCSPALLLLALNKILCLDFGEDSPEVIDLKKSIYNLLYMDNCAYSCNDSKSLRWAYDNLNDI